MEDRVRLRWTSHQGTVLSVFEALLSNESYVDVTLTCEGQYIRAHRIILSACSPYFQDLLDLDTSKHPIFFLKDVKFTELQALIEYMYRGEVKIAQADLESFLAVAQALKVRGLVEVDKSQNNVHSETIMVPDRVRDSLVSQQREPTSVAPPTQVPLSRSHGQPQAFSTPARLAAKKLRLDNMSCAQSNTVPVDPLLLPRTADAVPPFNFPSTDEPSTIYSQDTDLDGGNVSLEESDPFTEMKQDTISVVDLEEFDDEEEEEYSMDQSNFHEEWLREEEKEVDGKPRKTTRSQPVQVGDVSIKPRKGFEDINIEPSAKTRRKFDYSLARSFSNAVEAILHVKSENKWDKKYESKSFTTCRMYYCCKVDRNCPARLYLLVDEKLGHFEMHVTNQEHNHPNAEDIPELPDETKDEIRRIFASGVKSPTGIFNRLEQIGVELPQNHAQLVSFIRILKWDDKQKQT